MTVTINNSIADIDASAWDALVGDDYPFLRHSFRARPRKAAQPRPRPAGFPAI